MRLLCSKVLAADSMRHGKLNGTLKLRILNPLASPQNFFKENWMSLLNKSKRSNK